MKCKTITLDVDGTVTVEEYDGCKDIYKIIGRGCRTFEVLRCGEHRHALPCQAMIDEEGKMNGQPVNVPATDFLREHRAIDRRDHIAGKIMFVGPPDDQGEATDVDMRLERIFREFGSLYDRFLI